MSPDGKFIVSGSGDQTIKVWSLASGECLRTLQGHISFVTSVAVSGDGKFIVSGSGDQTIKVWSLASGECLRTLQGHTRRVNSVAVSGDGKFIVSGSDDQSIKVWSLASGGCLRTLQGHTSFVTSVAVSGDGEFIVSGSSDQSIKVWTKSQVFSVLGSTEGFETGSKRWSPLSDLHEPRWQHAAAAADATSVVVTGGLARDGTPLASSELYDALADTWDAQAVPPMLTARVGHALVTVAAASDGAKPR
jgi:WD40 repeat protein